MNTFLQNIVRRGAGLQLSIEAVSPALHGAQGSWLRDTREGRTVPEILREVSPESEQFPVSAEEIRTKSEATQSVRSKPVASDSVRAEVVQRMEAPVEPSARSSVGKPLGQMPAVTAETAGASVSPESLGIQFMPRGALQPPSAPPNVRGEAEERLSETPSGGAITQERKREIPALRSVDLLGRKEAVERMVREEPTEMSMEVERESRPGRSRIPAIERSKLTGISQSPVESLQAVRISPRAFQPPLFNKTAQPHPLSQGAHSSQLPIHVQIGRIEVRDAAGPAPMPTKTTTQTPLGFSAYHRVRNYRS